MVHMLASVAFTFIALGAFAVILLSLVTGWDKIAVALGLDVQPVAVRTHRRPVRIRTAGRWQPAMVSAPKAQPRRAAA